MRHLVTCLVILAAVVFTSAALTQESLFVLEDGTGVYRQSSTLSDQLVKLAAGDQVTVVDRWGAWVQVEVADTPVTGWVLSNRLGAVFPPPEPPDDAGTSPDEESPTEPPSAIWTQEYRIELDGPLARRFRMTCKFVRGSGETSTREFVESFPHTVLIKARSINCFIRRHNPRVHTDRMVVKIFVDDQLMDTFHGRFGILGYRIRM